MNYLYATPSPSTLPENYIGKAVFSEAKGDTDYWLSAEEIVEAGWTLVSAHHDDGVALFLSTGYNDLVQFGNDAGMATDQLDYHHWQGHKQRQMQMPDEIVPDTLPQYPADIQPITLTMERVWDDTPGWEGWGWLATIEFSDPNRAPDARAIGIYDSGWNYLYTTGAFIWTDTGEVDADGQPIFKWRTNNPAGRATATKESVFYGLLWGSIPEGQIELPPDTDEQTRNFWDRDQGGTPTQVGTWVDSGATVRGAAGTATTVTDTTPFSVGMATRINGVEQEINSVGGGWINLIPYQNPPHAAGSVIEIQG